LFVRWGTQFSEEIFNTYSSREGVEEGMINFLTGGKKKERVSTDTLSAGKISFTLEVERVGAYLTRGREGCTGVKRGGSGLVENT